MRFVAIFTLTIFFLPIFAHSAELININTADAETLDTLPGVGPSTAASIIANRPYASIEDISRADGIGDPGSSSYEKIKSLITVGDAPASNPAPVASSTSSDTASTTETTATPQSNSGGGMPEYLPIPALRIITATTRTVSTGADIAFTASVYDSKGNRRDDAFVTWSFGDGMKRTGASVYHKYYDPGEYLAVVRAVTSDGGDASAETIITAKNAGIRIISISDRGITLSNNDSRTLDLSLWRLSAGGQEFKIPEDTQILAGRTVLFPLQIIQLPISDTASLLYPSGELAAAYPATSAAQLTSGAAGYSQVQKVEPIISAKTNIQEHDEAVVAPAAANELAAAGAALLDESQEQAPRASGIFKSPWTLGFLGVVALAGSAFIFL